MADNARTFIGLANFYNDILTIMSAICAQKGGIPMENYVGRFFAADVLEFIAAYGKKIEGKDKRPEIANLVVKLDAEYKKVKDLTTPSQKPIHEMTLAEFEKVMNI